MQELAQEIEGRPEEVRERVAGLEAAGAIRERLRLEARAGVEEDMMTRVPLSKVGGPVLRLCLALLACTGCASISL